MLYIQIMKKSIWVEIFEEFTVMKELKERFCLSTLFIKYRNLGQTWRLINRCTVINSILLPNIARASEVPRLTKIHRGSQGMEEDMK